MTPADRYRSIVATANEFGVSRQAIYGWLADPACPLKAERVAGALKVLVTTISATKDWRRASLPKDGGQ